MSQETMLKAHEETPDLNALNGAFRRSNWLQQGFSSFRFSPFDGDLQGAIRGGSVLDVDGHVSTRAARAMVWLNHGELIRSLGQSGALGVALRALPVGRYQILGLGQEKAIELASATGLVEPKTFRDAILLLGRTERVEPSIANLVRTYTTMKALQVWQPQSEGVVRIEDIGHDVTGAGEWFWKGNQSDVTRSDSIFVSLNSPMGLATIDTDGANGFCSFHVANQSTISMSQIFPLSDGTVGSSTEEVLKRGMSLVENVLSFARAMGFSKLEVPTAAALDEDVKGHVLPQRVHYGSLRSFVDHAAMKLQMKHSPSGYWSIEF